MAGSSGFSPYVELYSSLDEPVCVSGLVLKVEDSYIDLPFWEFQPFSYYPITAQPIEGVTSIIRDALASTLFTENKKSLSLELIHHGRIIHQVKINIDRSEERRVGKENRLQILVMKEIIKRKRI